MPSPIALFNSRAQNPSVPPDALTRAVLMGDLEAVTALLRQGADINAKDNSGSTALITSAAVKDYLEIEKLLIEKGASLDVKDNNGNTALLWAALCGNEQSVRLLIEKGANLNEKNGINNTALLWAARNGYREIARLLIINGADINIKDRFGKTPLSWATCREDTELLEMLNNAPLLRQQQAETKEAEQEHLIQTIAGPLQRAIPATRPLRFGGNK